MEHPTQEEIWISEIILTLLIPGRYAPMYLSWSWFKRKIQDHKKMAQSSLCCSVNNNLKTSNTKDNQNSETLLIEESKPSPTSGGLPKKEATTRKFTTTGSNNKMVSQPVVVGKEFGEVIHTGQHILSRINVFVSCFAGKNNKTRNIISVKVYDP